MDLFREYEDTNDDDQRAGKDPDNTETRLEQLSKDPVCDTVISELENDIKSKYAKEKL